jgi:hypothetical protein
MKNIVTHLKKLANSTVIALFGLTSSCGGKATSNLAGSTIDPASLSGGTWAKQLILASESSAAGIKSNGTIERLLLVKADKKADRLETREELCDITSASSKSTKLTFPEAFKRSLPVRTTSYRLAYDGSKLQLSTPSITEVIGAKLDSPSSDELPNRASDPRVYDQDGDQQPGSTVEVSASALFVSLSGKVYITQRTILEENGVAASSDRIDGKVKWTIEQQVLGSDSTVLGAVSPKISPDLENSRFSMVRLADDATCETILTSRDQLFGR